MRYDYRIAVEASPDDWEGGNGLSPDEVVEELTGYCDPANKWNGRTRKPSAREHSLFVSRIAAVLAKGEAFEEVFCGERFTITPQK